MGEGGDGYGYAPSGRIWLRLRAQRRIWLYLGICAALYLRGKLKSGPITAFRRAQVEPTGTYCYPYLRIIGERAHGCPLCREGARLGRPASRFMRECH